MKNNFNHKIYYIFLNQCNFKVSWVIFDINVDVPITTTAAAFGTWMQLSSVQYQSLPLSLLDSDTSVRTVPVVDRYLAEMDDTSIYKC